jgi:hypothetical protein
MMGVHALFNPLLKIDYEQSCVISLELAKKIQGIRINELVIRVPVISSLHP